MEKENKGLTILKKSVAYILVAALSSVLTLLIYGTSQSGQSPKLNQLRAIIDEMFIGEVDAQLMEDMMAAGMVQSLGDQWSYYIPADQYQEYMDSHANAYVGIGVTVQLKENEDIYEIQQVEPNGPAKTAGILPGDVIVAVDGQRGSEIGSEVMLNMISGEEGTKVSVTVLRENEEITFDIIRQNILAVVASGEMVTENIGYIKINNFNERCAEETIAIFEDLESQGAKSIIFDVRFNPGGYVHEMIEILDYLLPEGVLFRSEDYSGMVSEETSDENCKDIPMVVLMNRESVSAAEFFAAALHEYDYAITVGQPTLGKGYFQQGITLSDGSAVNLSVGKYYTPNGVSLSEVGGLQPDELIEVDEETMAKIYSGLIEKEDDQQLQKAIELLLNNPSAQ